MWGTFVGMMLLLVLRNVGGMGAGDVKLLAGIGAWLGAMITLKAFAATCIVGGIMAAWMIWRSGRWEKHYAMAHQIMHEWKTFASRANLAAIARERKPEHVPVAVWNPNGNRIDRLLRLRRNADLIDDDLELDRTTTDKL